jgi:ferritin
MERELTMLSKRMEKALNSQINAELASSYLYLSMSANFMAQNLKGFAKWMSVQAKEENIHAMKFYDYVIERGGKVVLQTIAQPKTEWDSALAAFKDTYAHEQKVTALIHDLVNLAASEKDHATSVFLQWFVTEQVEEEANASAAVQQLTMIGDSKGSLFMLDHQMGKRE